MELGTGWTQLNNSFKVLQAHWEGLKQEWRDVAQDDFETRATGRPWKPK